MMRDKSTSMKVFSFSRFKAITLITVAMVLIFTVVGSISWIVAKRLTDASMSGVLVENFELRRQLVGMNQRLTDFNQQLGELYGEDDRLRILADIPKIDEDVRQVGIGGIVSPEVSMTHDDETVSKLIFDLDKIERELRLQRASFTEIKKQFIEKADLIDHTPSIRPIDSGYLSSRFGMRRDPFNGRRTHHNGIDYSVERGTPIMATANGKVIFAKRTPGLGKLVIIEHGYGFRTAYGHMNRILVKKGQTVERWQKIGEVGSTGRSTAPHLHYEVHIDRKATDPRDYIFDNYAAQNKVK